MGARRYGLGDGERDQPLIERGPEPGRPRCPRGNRRRCSRRSTCRSLPERFVGSTSEAGEAADEIGYPVVTKLKNGDTIAHKTERGAASCGSGSVIGPVPNVPPPTCSPRRHRDAVMSMLLVAPMISGNRELIAGMVRDPQFGPTVMLGVGGILAEAVADVVFRPAPVSTRTALDMIDSLADAEAARRVPR